MTGHLHCSVHEGQSYTEQFDFDMQDYFNKIVISITLYVGKGQLA